MAYEYIKEVLTFPDTRAMSGASRGSLRFWRKNKRSHKVIGIDQEFTKAAAKLHSIPTKRKRNNQRVRQGISIDKSLYRDFSKGYIRKRASEWAKEKRKKLKQSQIDHLIRDYPLIEAIINDKQ